MRKRIEFHKWLVHEKNLLIIYSKIYSAFTFSRLGETCFWTADYTDYADFQQTTYFTDYTDKF